MKQRRQRKIWVEKKKKFLLIHRKNCISSISIVIFSGGENEGQNKNRVDGVFVEKLLDRVVIFLESWKSKKAQDKRLYTAGIWYA